MLRKESTHKLQHNSHNPCRSGCSILLSNITKQLPSRPKDIQFLFHYFDSLMLAIQFVLCYVYSVSLKIRSWIINPGKHTQFVLNIFNCLWHLVIQCPQMWTNRLIRPENTVQTIILIGSSSGRGKKQTDDAPLIW